MLGQMWWGGRTITFIISSCLVKVILVGTELSSGRREKLHPSVLLKKNMAFSLCVDADQHNDCAGGPVGHVLETPQWPLTILGCASEPDWGNHTRFVKKVTTVSVSNRLEIDKRISNYMCANWVFIRVLCIPWCPRGRRWWASYSGVSQFHMWNRHLQSLFTSVMLWT